MVFVETVLTTTSRLRLATYGTPLSHVRTPVCHRILFVLLYQGNAATLNFYLTNFTDVASLQNAIRNIAYLGGWTNTTGALRVACTEIFNTANGDRSDVPNVIVLITDGVPNIDVHLLAGEVARCKARGIRILGVGVTNQVSYSSLVHVCSSTIAKSCAICTLAEAVKCRLQIHLEITGGRTYACCSTISYLLD